MVYFDSRRNFLSNDFLMSLVRCRVMEIHALEVCMGGSPQKVGMYPRGGGGPPCCESSPFYTTTLENFGGIQTILKISWF